MEIDFFNSLYYYNIETRLCMSKIKIITFLVINFIFLFPDILCANEQSSPILVNEVVKYYKTTINYFGQELSEISINNGLSSNTIEISENEYESSNYEINFKNAFIETNYKKLTLSVYKVGNFCRYKSNLSWKKIPKTRSFDIQGIDYDDGLTIDGQVKFVNKYCFDVNNCHYSYNATIKKFDSAVGITFELPSGSLNYLESELSFDVKKNSNFTVNSQTVVSDYSHAIKTISLSNSQKYNMNNNGIILGNISSYYDNINPVSIQCNDNW